ncbi:13952_t:CDS:2, partial [Funneliformis geosporum]
GQTAFDNLASIQKLFEKVVVKKTDGTIEKIADEFIVAIKKLKKADGSEAGINTLSELISQKEPTEVIKIIIREDDKYLDDAELTEEEITNTLYEIAIGKKTLASEKKADETNGDDTENLTDKMSIAKE